MDRRARLILSIALIGSIAQAGPSDERAHVAGTQDVAELFLGDLSLLGGIPIAGAAAVRAARDGSTWVLEGDGETLWRFEPDGSTAFALPLDAGPLATHVALAVDESGD